MVEKEQEVSLLIDDQVFKVRKDMLSEHSDYFRAMFSGNYVEKEQKEISIDVVDANSMNLILRYMEIGLIDISEHPLSTIYDLAFAANFLQITELTKQIDFCLEQQLSLSNWMEIKGIAQHAPSLKLEQACIEYGLYSFKSMKPEFIPTLLKLYWYLSHPYLNTESELEVFKFGLQWIQAHEMGADHLLVILCCLDMSRLSNAELKEIKELTKEYVNSLAEKLIDCLYKLTTDFELSLMSIHTNKQKLCELYSQNVYNEVFTLVKDSIKRKLRFIPAVPMHLTKDSKPEKSPNHLYTFTEEFAFQKWIEISEKNLWGWNIASWTPTQIVMVCGEYCRGTGHFMRDVKVYDINKREWIHHGVELPVRRHAGITIVGDSLYIVGGVGAYRVVLDTAIVYDLKQRTYRKIAKLPDTIQSPAVCNHEDQVYAAGDKNIYKYEDFGDHDTWSVVMETDKRLAILVSYKGYIYGTQGYYNNLFRFRPGVDTVLENVTSFCYPPVAMCKIGRRLLAFTSTGPINKATMAVEEFKEASAPDKKPGIEVLVACVGVEYTVNRTAGTCAVVMATPPIYPDVPLYHERYLCLYG